jgi:hypothetical protein
VNNSVGAFTGERRGPDARIDPVGYHEPKVCPAGKGPVDVARAAVLDSHLREERMQLHAPDLVAAADARILHAVGDEDRARG